MSPHVLFDRYPTRLLILNFDKPALDGYDPAMGIARDPAGGGGGETPHKPEGGPK